MSIINTELLQDRGGELKGKGLNGIKFVLVSLLNDTTDPTEAHLHVHFYNELWLSDIKTGFNPTDKATRDMLSIAGGHRVTAGWEKGQVHVVSAEYDDTLIPQSTILDLGVTPIGDYSSYTLIVTFDNGSGQKIYPMLSQINFKFRPGCFNIDCAPARQTIPTPKEAPQIDYLSKDYDSFKHTLINAMMERVPNWQATSEADLDQVLIDLFSAAADELSDYQDRVMNEAYLGSARKRVSLARHARLMDYHIHQGNQASTWLAMEVESNLSFTLPKGFVAWTGTGIEPNTIEPDAAVFMSRNECLLDSRLNRIGLYTWGDTQPALKAGSISADLIITDGNNTDAKAVAKMIETGTLTHLLIQENKNPATGSTGGVNPQKREILTLLTGKENVTVKKDPFANLWVVTVQWQPADKLKYNYCFTIDCSRGAGPISGAGPNSGAAANISFFNGNLVQVYHGMPRFVVFKDPGEILATDEYHYQRTPGEKWGTICPLPTGPLIYKGNQTEANGEMDPKSTLEIKVVTSSGTKKWEEVISLTKSGSDGERGTHFAVETDEDECSIIRFGNGINGKQLPQKAKVECSYQEGFGLQGNIGADKLSLFDDSFACAPTSTTCIKRIWNPLDVSDGRAPEPVHEIIRRVPEAYKARQLRAVTLDDYKDRAEELEKVSHAAARYAWTGSWRTVQVAIDPVGATTLSPELIIQVSNHLEAVRLIGEDIEIRSPIWVPLMIEVYICVLPQYWPQDIKDVLDMEFSEDLLPDHRRAFFHPEEWTFGQALHASQIIGRVQRVQGVDHVKNLSMKLFNRPTRQVEPTSGGLQGIVKVKSNEIIQVRNNPDHMEEGSITFFVEGGRS
jgi:Baseplate J-like protein